MGFSESSRAHTQKQEQTGKPTYHSYSSIPIEQASGPRAAQSEEVQRDRMAEKEKRSVRKQRSTQVR